MSDAQASTGFVTDLDGLRDSAGRHLGWSSWKEVTQEMIDRFADLTGDHNWIHVDTERAATGPFGKTIAHGYLTLSLVPPLLGELLEVQGITMPINYGIDRLRFPSPVPVGSRIRVGGEVAEANEVAGGVQVKLALTFEVEGGTKPACVAEILLRFYA